MEAGRPVQGHTWLYIKLKVCTGYETISLQPKNKHKYSEFKEFYSAPPIKITFFFFSFLRQGLKLASNSTFISVMLGLQMCTTILCYTIFTTTQQLETYFPKYKKTKRTREKHLNGLPSPPPKTHNSDLFLTLLIYF